MVLSSHIPGVRASPWLLLTEGQGTQCKRLVSEVVKQLCMALEGYESDTVNLSKPSNVNKNVKVLRQRLASVSTDFPTLALLLCRFTQCSLGGTRQSVWVFHSLVLCSHSPFSVLSEWTHWNFTSFTGL